MTSWNVLSRTTRVLASLLICPFICGVRPEPAGDDRPRRLLPESTVYITGTGFVANETVTCLWCIPTATTAVRPPSVDRVGRRERRVLDDVVRRSRRLVRRDVPPHCRRHHSALARRDDVHRQPHLRHGRRFADRGRRLLSRLHPGGGRQDRTTGRSAQGGTYVMTITGVTECTGLGHHDLRPEQRDGQLLLQRDGRRRERTRGPSRCPTRPATRCRSATSAARARPARTPARSGPKARSPAAAAFTSAPPTSTARASRPAPTPTAAASAPAR